MKGELTPERCSWPLVPYAASSDMDVRHILFLGIAPAQWPNGRHRGRPYLLAEIIENAENDACVDRCVEKIADCPRAFIEGEVRAYFEGTPSYRAGGRGYTSAWWRFIYDFLVSDESESTDLISAGRDPAKARSAFRRLAWADLYLLGSPTKEPDSRTRTFCRKNADLVVDWIRELDPKITILPIGQAKMSHIEVFFPGVHTTQIGGGVDYLEHVALPSPCYRMRHPQGAPTAELQAAYSSIRAHLGRIGVSSWH